MVRYLILLPVWINIEREWSYPGQFKYYLQLSLL